MSLMKVDRVLIWFLFDSLSRTCFQGIDILAGVEAVISHLVVKEFQIPCAHAPALSPLPLTSSLSPKSAAEEVCEALGKEVLLSLLLIMLEHVYV